MPSRLFRWRSPETRMQIYLEIGDCPRGQRQRGQAVRSWVRCCWQRYRDIFHRLYKADRALAIRRDGWGFVLGLIGTLALYGAYAWVAFAAVVSRITLGQMTMYLMLFRQGQSAVSRPSFPPSAACTKTTCISPPCMNTWKPRSREIRRQRRLRGPHPR